MTAKVTPRSDLLEPISQVQTFLIHPSKELISILSPVTREELELNSANFLQLKLLMAFVDLEPSRAFDLRTGRSEMNEQDRK